MTKLKINVVFTQKFFSYCKKFNSTLSEGQIEDKIKQFLEWKRINGEVTLPNGKIKNSVFFKLKIQNGIFSERWVGCFLTANFNVIPVFFANKSTKFGSNVSWYEMEQIFSMFSEIFAEIKTNRDLKVHTMTLDVEKIEFGTFSIP